MDYDAHVAAVEREVAAISRALRDGPLDARVPSCPEWSVAELAHHLGMFTMWSHVLCEGTGRPKPDFPDPPVGDPAILDWWDARAADLLTELRATPPDTPIWTWVTSDKTARFAARRAANELAVHRVDAQLARGPHDPIDAELAADGIDEILVMRNDSESPDPHVGRGQVLHLCATDVEGGEWTLTFQPDRVYCMREHVEPDACNLSVRGAVSDLELLLYQRPILGPVERVGDETMLEVWSLEFTFA